jgi:hypothetical protein
LQFGQLKERVQEGLSDSFLGGKSCRVIGTVGADISAEAVANWLAIGVENAAIVMREWKT